jgi:hypothetical protein
MIKTIQKSEEFPVRRIGLIEKVLDLLDKMVCWYQDLFMIDL